MDLGYGIIIWALQISSHLSSEFEYDTMNGNYWPLQHGTKT